VAWRQTRLPPEPPYAPEQPNAGRSSCSSSERLEIRWTSARRLLHLAPQL